MSSSVLHPLPRLRWRAALLAGLAFAAFAAALSPGHAQARVPSSFVGMTSEDTFSMPGAYRHDQFILQKGDGVGLFRQVFDWSAIETSKGHYDGLAAYDQYVIDATNKGITILPIVVNAPAFRAASLPRGAAKNTTRLPRNFNDYSAFTAVLARRYGPHGTVFSGGRGNRKYGIRSWQLWNEPNLPVYWGGRKPDGRSYVKLLAAGAKGIKHVDRGAEIVTAGLPQSRARGSVPVTKYIGQVLKAKGQRYFQTLGVNAYAPTAVGTFKLLGVVRQLLNRGGAGRAKMWLTEVGWADKCNAPGPNCRSSRFNLRSQRNQANQVVKVFVLLAKQRRKLNIRGVVYYNWHDAVPYAGGKDFVGLHMGLIDAAGHPKAAFGAFGTAARRLR